MPCQSFRETERLSLSQSAKAPASTRRRSGIARCQAFVLHHVMTGGGAGGLVQRTRCRVDTGLASQDARSSASRGGGGRVGATTRCRVDTGMASQDVRR